MTRCDTSAWKVISENHNPRKSIINLSVPSFPVAKIILLGKMIVDFDLKLNPNLEFKKFYFLIINKLIQNGC
jgi:hypothetical protein